MWAAGGEIKIVKPPHEDSLEAVELSWNHKAMPGTVE